MINQICYVLTSTGYDLYAQMTFISASLSRKLYPDAQIIILVDEITDDNLIKCDSPLIKLANRIVRVETGIEKAAPRSRFVKTSMRQVLDGDFVFIDADALPIRGFDEINSTGAPMSAALDLDDLLDKPHIPLLAIDNLRKCGSEVSITNYFNSGVIYMADTPETRQFGIEWHKAWKNMWMKTGDHRDQITFNSVLVGCDINIFILPAAYNAAVSINPWKARNAKILHYWMNAANGQVPPHSFLTYLLNYQEKKGAIDWDAVDKARNNPLSFNSYREILVPLFFGPGGGGLRNWVNVCRSRLGLI